MGPAPDRDFPRVLRGVLFGVLFAELSFALRLEAFAVPDGRLAGMSPSQMESVCSEKALNRGARVRAQGGAIYNKGHTGVK